MNSLTQTVLKLTCPGVPDFYQGSELWDFSLVDPDNRRPVDYALRREQLERVADAEPRELLAAWHDGRIKMFTIHRLLKVRREHPELFARGSYSSLAVHGSFAEKVIAFERRGEHVAVMVIVSRHTASLGFPPVGDVWADTHLISSAASLRWRDVFTGCEYTGEKLSLPELFADLPFAVLVAEL